MAATSKLRIEKKTGKPVKTLVVPIHSFTPAEDYHQKYILKHHFLKKEILRFYPDHKDFIDSTAAARLNGYAGGYGTMEQLSREIDALGLSKDGKAVLTDMVNKKAGVW
jgi:hypothetical protein